jgi:quercetin dioxygenase-like cupin family protein
MHRLARAHPRATINSRTLSKWRDFSRHPYENVIKLPSCSHALCGGGERLGRHRRLSMKIALPTLIAAVAVAGVASTAPADAMEGHMIVPPQEIKWGPAPAVLPPGAEAAVLFGDPSEEGLFVLRLKLPAGYSVAPHTHPVDEVITVISGTFRLGMGETADQRTAQTLPAGSFFALPPGMAHYVFIDEETVVQISTVGPWGLTYINPKDDPRQKTQ